MVREIPVVERVFTLGEPRVGRFVGQLSQSEKFVAAEQKIVAQTFKAKRTLDRCVQTALQAMNLSNTADVRAVKDNVGELEATVARVAGRVDMLAASAETKPRPEARA